MKKVNKGSLKKTYSEAWKFLKSCKYYILFSVALFFVVGIIGFIFPVFFVEDILALLRELMASFDGLNAFETIVYIFWNNLKASFMAFISGILFGLGPLIVSVTNGYLLGFVANEAVSEAGFLVLWRLLPHGIFELPAIFISLGLGFRLAVSIFRGEVRESFFGGLKVFGLIVVPLLVLAAVIEGLLIAFV